MPKALLSEKEWSTYLQIMFNPRLPNDIKCQVFTKINVDARCETKDEGTFLIQAYKRGEIGVARFLLSQGASPDAKDQDGNPLLFLSLQHTLPDFLKLLLEFHADVNVTHSGNSLLHLTSMQGSWPLSLLLLDNKADIHQLNRDGLSPLWFSAGTNVLITKWLVEKGAQINFINEVNPANAYSPLGRAAFAGEADIVNLLLKMGADPNFISTQTPITPLDLAAQNNEIKIINRLLKAKADPNIVNEKNQTPLLTAIDRNHFEAAIALLKGGANPNIVSSTGVSAVFLVIDNAEKTYNKGIANILQWLYRYRANFNLLTSDGDSALRAACRKQNLPLVEKLLDFGADPNQSITFELEKRLVQGNVLHLVVRLRNPKMQLIETILKKIKNVNAEETPSSGNLLFFAVSTNNFPLFNLLLEKKANVNATTKKNLSVLMLAVTVNKNVKFVKKLLESSSLQIGLCSSNGQTALHVASSTAKNQQIIQLLCSSFGIEVNAQCNDGATPLFIAAQEGEKENLICLLANGADPKICRNDGQSPLFIAHDEGHRHVVEILLDHYFITDGKKIETYFIMEEILLPNNKRLLSIGINIKKDDQQIDNANTLIYEPQTDIPQSAHAFLTSQGFSKEQIKQFQKDRKNPPSEKLSTDEQTTLPILATWENKSVTHQHPEIREIERRDDILSFFYLDQQGLYAQGCFTLSHFQDMERIKFCPPDGQPGLKPIKGEPLEKKVILNGKKEDVTLTHELKVKSTLDRILCFPWLSDDKKYCLYIAALYVPSGFHKKHSLFAIQVSTKVITINLPSTDPLLKENREVEELKKRPYP